MNQEMINILPTTPKHTTPIHNREASSPQIITSKNPPPMWLSKQKDTLLGAFTPQILFKGKVSAPGPLKAL